MRSLSFCLIFFFCLNTFALAEDHCTCETPAGDFHGYTLRCGNRVVQRFPYDADGTFAVQACWDEKSRQEGSSSSIKAYCVGASLVDGTSVRVQAQFDFPLDRRGGDLSAQFEVVGDFGNYETLYKYVGPYHPDDPIDRVNARFLCYLPGGGANLNSGCAFIESPLQDESFFSQLANGASAPIRFRFGRDPNNTPSAGFRFDLNLSCRIPRTQN